MFHVHYCRLQENYEVSKDVKDNVKLKDVQSEFFLNSNQQMHVTEIAKNVRVCFSESNKRKITDSETKSRVWVYEKIRKRVPLNENRCTLENVWDSIKNVNFQDWTLLKPSESLYTWNKIEIVQINYVNIVRKFSLTRDGTREFNIHGKQIHVEQLFPVINLRNDIHSIVQQIMKTLKSFSNLKLCRGFTVTVEKSTYNSLGTVAGICERWSLDGSTVTSIQHRAVNCEVIINSSSKQHFMCHSCSKVKVNSFYKTLQPQVVKPLSQFKRESYMSVEEKSAKLNLEKTKRKAIEKREVRLRKTISDTMHAFEKDDSSDLATMFNLIQPEKLTDEMKLFYKVQSENLNKENSKGYRWHPK